MIVTTHAIQRYVERIDPSLSPDQARARIEASAAAIDAAARFGAHVVRQSCGAKLVLDEDRVVTVIARRWNASDTLRRLA